MDEMIKAAVTIATAIIGLAILAVLVSSRGQTPAVIQSLGGAFSQSLTAAEAPVLGSSGAYGGYGHTFGETLPIY